MKRKLNRIEEAAVVECLREIHGNIHVGFGDAQSTANLIVAADSSIPQNKAKECIDGKFVSQAIRSKIAKVALPILQSKKNEIISIYRSISKETAAYLAHLLAPEPRAIDVIFQNWVRVAEPVTASAPFKTSLYQIFRRYKPVRGETDSADGGVRHLPGDLEHNLICELIYVDAERMECIVVTSELNVYFGSLSLNLEGQIYGILQRIDRVNGGVHQRLIVSHLENREYPIYSGLCVKTGDTTHRPVASECFYLKVGKGHDALNQFMVDLYNNVKADPAKYLQYRLPRDSIAADYVTDNPPIDRYDKKDSRWARVKFVREFPVLAKRAVPDSKGVTVFREPSRSVDLQELVAMSTAEPGLTVFRHTATVSDAPSEPG